MKKLLISILVVATCSSCSNYYQAITASEPTNAAGFKDFQDSSKYYILRNGSEAFGMKNISISSDRKNVHCTLEELPINHKLHVTNGAGGKMRYNTKRFTDEDETGVLNEVHIYLVPGSKPETGAYTLALENIQKAEIIEKDKIKTRKSHAMGAGITIGASLVVLALIAAIAASSSFIF